MIQRGAMGLAALLLAVAVLVRGAPLSAQPAARRDVPLRILAEHNGLAHLGITDGDFGSLGLEVKISEINGAWKAWQQPFAH